MKKTFYIKTAFLSLLGMSLLSSCLKDSRYVDFAGSKPLIELPAAAGIVAGGGTFEVESFAIQSAAQTFKVAVNIAAPNPLGTALTVKLGVDTAAITAYNIAQQQAYTADTTGDYASGTTPPAPPANYTALPTAAYSSNFTVTIPAGQNLGYVTITINSSVIDPSGNFILPIKITDGGGQQISNYDEILYNVKAKNAYDGIYVAKGVAVRLPVVAGDPYAGNFTGLNVPLATTSATTLSFAPVWANGALAGGVTGTTLTVDPTTNKVTVSSSGNATLANAPTYNNHYDPTNKVFYISYIWSSGNRAETDTLTYSASR